MEMFRDYPGMARERAPENTDAYNGHVLVNDSSFQIKLRKTPNGWIVPIDSNAQDHIETCRVLNAQNYQEPHQYLDALTSRLKPLHPSYQFLPIETYRKVLKEYADFVNFHCYLEEVKLHADLSAISVLHVDEKFRNHYVTISVNSREDAQGKLFRIAQHKLPEETDAAADSLISLFHEFAQRVEAYQKFFDTMDLIDQNFWILAPQLPARSDARRRVYLEKNFSAEIIFNPKYPSELPFVNLYGPPRMAQPFQKVLQRNFRHWHEDGDVLDELLKFFDMAVFPAQRMACVESAFAPCGVCRCHLGVRDELPEMFCPNAPCEQSFHVECLYNCLRQSVLGSLRKVSGKCPYCRRHIECGDPAKRQPGEGNAWW